MISKKMDGLKNVILNKDSWLDLLEKTENGIDLFKRKYQKRLLQDARLIKLIQ
jgi:hypothetical protein